MKKIIGLLCAAAMTFTVFAAPKTGVDGEMPKTTPVVLDDFEEGMYLNAVRDGWDSFGNVFMKTQFSTNSKTAKSWTGKGNCGVLEYAAHEGTSGQGCIYECLFPWRRIRLCWRRRRRPLSRSPSPAPLLWLRPPATLLNSSAHL